MNNALVYSIPEACSLARIGRTALYQAINRGDLPARKRGKRTLILHDDLCRYVQSLPAFMASSAQPAETRAAAQIKTRAREGALA